MRKTILLMFLAVVGSSAAAEWVEVGTGRSGTITSYADPATIRRAGNMVKMWSLRDYKTPEVVHALTPYMSRMAQDEYDCKEERTRTLYFSLYSENMGEGVAGSTVSDPGKWSPVPPGTLGESLWKLA